MINLRYKNAFCKIKKKISVKNKTKECDSKVFWFKFLLFTKNLQAFQDLNNHIRIFTITNTIANNISLKCSHTYKYVGNEIVIER